MGENKSEYWGNLVSMIKVIELSSKDAEKEEDEIYSLFLRLKLDENISNNEVYKKLGLKYECSLSRRLRKRFRRDGFNVSQKKTWLRMDKNNKYIHERDDKFVIWKRDKYNHNHYFGAYDSLEEAIKFRDMLVENNWDKKILKKKGFK